MKDPTIIKCLHTVSQLSKTPEGRSCHTCVKCGEITFITELRPCGTCRYMKMKKGKSFCRKWKMGYSVKHKVSYPINTKSCWRRIRDDR